MGQRWNGSRYDDAGELCRGRPRGADCDANRDARNVLLFNRDVDTFSGAHSLWRTDGTAAGTYQLRTGDSGAGFFELDPSLVVVGGQVFFVSASMGRRQELWKTDGTVAGTMLVKDIALGPDDSGPTHLTELNGMLLFSADTGLVDSGRELWKSNGTSAGTTLVKDIRPGSDSGFSTTPSIFVSFNNILYFAADDGTSGMELWRSDGTSANTNMVADAVTGGQGLWPESFVPLGSKLLFTSGSFSPDGVQLWETDGTALGTALLADIDGPGSASASISELTMSGSMVFFRGYVDASGIELWRTDGTSGGTIQLADLRPGSASGLVSILSTGLGGVLFQGNDGVHGNELGVSDGTPAGTRLLDVARGTPGANIEGVFQFDSDFYLAALGDLWFSDGTAGGTTRLKDFPSSIFGTPQFTEADGTVFFVAEGSLRHRQGTLEDRWNGGRVGHGQGYPRRLWRQRSGSCLRASEERSILLPMTGFTGRSCGKAGVDWKIQPCCTSLLRGLPTARSKQFCRWAMNSMSLPMACCTTSPYRS